MSSRSRVQPPLGLITCCSSVGRAVDCKSICRVFESLQRESRFRDVTVSIPDFESGYPGSNPGGTYLTHDIRE